MAARRTYLWVVTTAVLGASCGADDGSQTRDEGTAVDVADTSGGTDTEDRDALDLDSEPDAAPEIATTRDTEIGELSEVVVDRFCELEPLLGNGYSAAARCNACRDLVGNGPTTHVRAELLWDGTYDMPIVLQDTACPDAPDASCRARVVVAEVLYCENLQTHAHALGWSDVALVRAQSGADVETRGPEGGVLLGDIVDVDGVPLALAAVFQPARFRVRTKERVFDVTTLAPTRPHECPVGRFERREHAGDIGACERAMNLFNL